MAFKSKTPQHGASMKKLALIALSLSICFPLTGCIAPFRVKARAYATAEMTPLHVPAPTPPPAAPQ
jgi:hypothetical protein